MFSVVVLLKPIPSYSKFGNCNYQINYVKCQIAKVSELYSSSALTSVKIHSSNSSKKFNN